MAMTLYAKSHDGRSLVAVREVAGYGVAFGMRTVEQTAEVTLVGGATGTVLLKNLVVGRA